MSNAARLVTAEEFEKVCHDDRRYELVEGRVVRMTPVSLRHGQIVARIAGLLDSHVRGQRLPLLLAADVGFKLASNPDTVRGPDIAVIRRERVPSPPPRGFLNMSPDLVIEVLSPEDRPGEIREKVTEYLTRGVQLVIVFDPETRTATVSRYSTAPAVLREDDDLDLADVVPGFRCSVREIFE